LRTFPEIELCLHSVHLVVCINIYDHGYPSPQQIFFFNLFSNINQYLMNWIFIYEFEYSMRKILRVYKISFVVTDNLNLIWRVISLHSSKIVDKREILRTISNAGIYCSSDKVGTVYLLFRKVNRQHQRTLELVGGHGVLLICTGYSVLYSEIAQSRKPFGIRHMYINSFA
jgi:hypothetical protein